MIPQKAKVLRRTQENGKVATLTLDIEMGHAKPGQFVMVWVKGKDEKPMSISGVNPLTLTVANAGETSCKIMQSKVGDELFIRGPLGEGFAEKGTRWLLVGGGYGFAPLRYMAAVGVKNKYAVDAVLGARTKEALIASAVCKTHICTDDGSEGEKGNVIVAMERLLKERKYDCVYSCGPERMMKAVAECARSNKVESQLLIERYMKCGFGVCGHCAMGEFITCIDGPMIRGEDALKNPEFGLHHKDRAGRKIEW